MKKSIPTPAFIDRLQKLCQEHKREIDIDEMAAALESVRFNLMFKEKFDRLFDQKIEEWERDQREAKDE
jgi:hypothetical protein